jgi:hypothetical protein
VVGWEPVKETFSATLWRGDETPPWVSARVPPLPSEGLVVGSRRAEFPTVAALEVALADVGVEELASPVARVLADEQDALWRSTGGFRYEGSRRDGVPVVEVVTPAGERAELPHLVWRSVDGFEWGYRGSGPADLARSIVGHHTGEKNPDPRVCDAFERSTVAVLGGDRWSVSSPEVDARLGVAERGGERTGDAFGAGGLGASTAAAAEPGRPGVRAGLVVTGGGGGGAPGRCGGRGVA